MRRVALVPQDADAGGKRKAVAESDDDRAAVDRRLVILGSARNAVRTVEADEIFETYDPRTRQALREWMQSQGPALARHGADLNAAAPYYGVAAETATGDWFAWTKRMRRTLLTPNWPLMSEYPRSR